MTGAVHSKEEVLSLLDEIPQIVVATNSGPRIRTRMMHFANDDSFNTYLASMKADPKIMQLTGNPAVSLLALKYEGVFSEAREVEITGWAEMVEGKADREKWFKAIASKSPIVKYLVESGNTDVLALIRVKPEQVKYRVAKEIVQNVAPTVIGFPQNKRVEEDIEVLKRKVKSWVVGARLPFLTASLLPITLGTAVAWATAHAFNLLFFVLVMTGGVSLQLGTNILNDYYDHKNGTDDVNNEFVRPFSGGSRVIQLGLIAPSEVLGGGLVFLLIGASVGLFFVLSAGWVVLALMLVGLVSAYFYTAPPLNLASRGVGELFIGLNFGILMTFGAFYVQARVVSFAPLIASIPLALLIAAVVYINEFPDYAADKTTRKRHIVVRLGRKRAALGYVTIVAAAYVWILASVLAEALPPQTLIAFLGLPLAATGIRHALRHHSETQELIPANAATINVHLLTGLLLSFGYVLAAASAIYLTQVALVGLAFAGLSAVYIVWVHGKIKKLSSVAAGVRRTVS